MPCYWMHATYMLLQSLTPLTAKQAVFTQNAIEVGSAHGLSPVTPDLFNKDGIVEKRINLCYWRNVNRHGRRRQRH